MVDDELGKIVRWHTKINAKKRATSAEVQQGIYAIQETKQRIFQQLKIDIAALDDVGNKPEKKPDEISVHYDEAQKKFFAQDNNGQDQEVTIGDIMCDGDWGISYYLDPITVPRNVRKRYLIERAKGELRDYLDTQIVFDETKSQFTDSKKFHAYQEWQKAKDRGIYQSGFFSEKLVRNFMNKLTYNHDLPFFIIAGDVFQDVNQKIDFIIHRKSHHRGVDVETVDDADPSLDSDIGIKLLYKILIRCSKNGVQADR